MHIYFLVTQHPANGTFCEGSSVVLSCVIFDNTTNDAADATSWFFASSLVAVPDTMINNSRVHDVVTSTLTMESVSLVDNGIRCFCFLSFGVRSYTGVISVAGTYIHKHYLPMYVHTYAYIIRAWVAATVVL